MHIRYVAQACLRIEAAGQRILLDPMLFDDPATEAVALCHPPHGLALADLLPLDLVFSSHEHEDHCEGATLRALAPLGPRAVLPGGRPRLDAIYAAAGFPAPLRLAEGETAEVAPGVRMTAYWSDGVDSLLVLEAGGVTLLHQNDCAVDEAMARRIAARHRPDVVFAMHTANASGEVLALDRPEEELRRIGRARNLEVLEQQLAMLGILRPGVVVPYAYSTLLRARDCAEANHLGRVMPAEFAARVMAELPGVRPVILAPGDVLRMPEGVAEARGPARWAATADAHLAEAEARLAAAPPGREDTLAEHGPALLRHFQAVASNPRGVLARLRVRVEAQGPDGALHLLVDGPRRACRVLGSAAEASSLFPQAWLRGTVTGLHAASSGRTDVFMPMGTRQVVLGFARPPAATLEAELGLRLSLISGLCASRGA